MCLGGHLRIADAPDVSEDPLGLAGEAARISRRLEHPPPVHPAIATTYPAHLAPARTHNAARYISGRPWTPTTSALTVSSTRPLMSSSSRHSDVANWTAARPSRL